MNKDKEEWKKPRQKALNVIHKDVKEQMGKENQKKIKCPECGKQMKLIEIWDSLLKMAKWYKYGCFHCAGTFEVKRGKI